MAREDLTMIESLFINEYCCDWNAGAAMGRLADQGFVETKYHHQNGYKMLQIQRVADEVAKRRKAVLMAGELRVEQVVADIKAVLEADSHQLSQHHRDCCRYCHGFNHEYHYTAAEMKRARLAHEKISLDPFDEQGGKGFDPRRPPVADCPECHGRGVMTIVTTDTRNMDPTTAALYMGVKPGKHGTEILMRSKDQARKDAAAFLGMNKQTINLTETPLKDMTDEELAAFIASEEAKQK